MDILNGRLADQLRHQCGVISVAIVLRRLVLRGRWNCMRRGGALFVFGLCRARGLRPFSSYYRIAGPAGAAISGEKEMKAPLTLVE